jgi:cell division protein FtsW
MNDRPRRTLAASPGRTLRGRGVDAAGRRHKPDHWLLIITALLLTVGLVVVYSISPGLAASQHVSQNYYVTKQLIDVVLGMTAFWAASLVPLSVWRSAIKPLGVAALVGALVVMITPMDTVYQAHRWIRFGGFSFQVAELIKLALLLWLADFLTQKWQKGQLAASATLQMLLGLLLAIGIVVAKLESDFGSAAVMIAMMALMAYAAGVSLKKIALFSCVIVVLFAVAIGSTSYRRQRLQTFLHPQSNCLGSSYQACQALISVGSGGLTGLGLGYSVQAYGYLPEASDDSIFAIMAEKFGFIGSLAIVVLYGVFITRLKRIIEHTPDQFTRLLVVGVLAWMSTQLIINIGAMTGLLPLKGITLPLISQGGTSLVFLTAALGMVFQVSRYTSYNVTEPTTGQTAASDNSPERRGVRRPHNPSIVARPRT